MALGDMGEHSSTGTTRPNPFFRPPLSEQAAGGSGIFLVPRSGTMNDQKAASPLPHKAVCHTIVTGVSAARSSDARAL